MSTSRELELVRATRLTHLCRLDNSCIDNLTFQFEAVQIDAEEAAAVKHQVRVEVITNDCVS